MKSRTGVRLGTVLTIAAGLCPLAGETWARDAARLSVIEEILVTAQKRSESIRDVPASVSAISAVRIEQLGALQLTDYAGYVPGLTVDNGGAPGLNTITLRGISSGDSASSTVGVYVGDSPVGSSSAYAQGGRLALDLLPYDIERVEVLRGPQGTLYGASTLGGLLKYVMKSVDLNAFSSRFGGEGSKTSGAGDANWGARAMINAPVIPGKLALRASVSNQQSAGYIDNVTGRADVNDTQQLTARTALLWQPNDAVSLELAGILQDVDADGVSVVQLDGLTGRPAYGDLTRAHVVPETFRSELRLYTATLNWRIGEMTLTSATSYARTRFRQRDDQTDELNPLLEGLLGPAWYPAALDIELDKLTQEVRLASAQGGAVEWLLGGFYTKEDSANRQSIGIQLPGGTPFVGLDPAAAARLPSEYREVALFGDVTYRFSESFDVTAGVRWARNEQTFEQIDDGGSIIPIGEVRARGDDTVITYMLSPRYHFSEDLMLYGRVASGYRPGGANVALPGVPATYDADELINYEIGLKTAFADGRGVLDLAVFFIDWRDIQLVTVGGAGTTALANGGRAESKGVELTSAYSPLSGLQFALNAAYTEAELTENMPPLAGVAGQAGDTLPSAPEWSGSFSFDYEFLHTGGWTAAIGGGYRYAGARLGTFGPSASPRVRLDSYGMWDMNLRLFNERYSLRLFTKNLADERAYANAVTASSLAPVDAAVLTPRVVGLSIDVAL